MSSQTRQSKQSPRSTPAHVAPQIAEKSTWDWAPAAVLAVVVLAVFWRVCGHEFTDWDDDLNVTRNPYLYGQTLAGLLHFWLHAYQREYIPLSYTVWWLLSKLARVDTPDATGVALNPYIFHIANLLLHLGAALAAYALMRALSFRPWAACAGAVLFAVHPLQVEAVAWVTGLKDLLCGFLSLLALLYYVKFALGEVDPADRSRGWHYAAATILFTAAVLAKPSAITLPVMVLAIDLWILRRPIRRIAVSLVPWIAIAGVFTLVGLLAQPAKNSEMTAAPLAMRPLVAGETLAFYLGKLLLPVGLSPIYPHSIRHVLAGRAVWIAWLAPGALLASAWILRRRAASFIATVVIFFAAPLPVLGLVPFEYSAISTVADRYVYVGLLGPAMALGVVLSTLSSTRARRVSGVGCCLILALLGVLSYIHVGNWRDSSAVFTRVLEVDPSSDVAYCNLAADALSRGENLEALHDAQQAVAIDPTRAQNQVTLGIILQRLGRHPQAGAAFLSAVQSDPANVIALTNLASELGRVGQTDKALALCREALKGWPDSPLPHACMGVLLSQQGQDAAALPEAQTAIRLDPTDASSHRELGRILDRLGRHAEATQQYSIAQALSPGAPEDGPGADLRASPGR